MSRPIAQSALASCLIISMAAPCLAEPPPSTAPATEVQTDNFKHAIRKLYDLKESAWAAGDAESIITKFYSADAISAGEGDWAMTAEQRAGMITRRTTSLECLMNLPFVTLVPQPGLPPTDYCVTGGFLNQV